jgi:diguanylate cyclase (GGDEF)-like protein/PAS domain S-box-containing protein
MTQSPHLSRSLIKNSPVALALIAGDGRLAAVSSPFREQLAVTPEHLQGATLSEVLRQCGASLDTDALVPLVSGASDALRLTIRVQRPGRPHAVVAVFWRADGETGTGSRLVVQLEAPRSAYEEPVVASPASAFRQLFDQAPEPMALLDASGRCVYVNASFAAISGEEASSLLGQRDPALPGDPVALFPKRRTSPASPATGAAGAVMPSSGRKRVTGHRSLLHGPEVAFIPLYDPTDELSAVVAVNRSATELGDAVAELDFAQQLTGLGSWTLDPETGTVEFSEQMYALLGLDPELGPPMLEQVLNEHFAAADAEQLRDGIGVVLASDAPRTIELRYITASGSRRWLRLTAVVNPAVPGTLRGAAQDVTEGRLQLQQIDVVSSRFRHAFEDSHLAMSITALDGRILEANAAMLAMLGLTREQAQGQNMADMLLSEDRAIRDDLIAAAIAGTRDSFELESHIVRGDGSLMWVVRHITVLRNSDGGARELLTQMLDATEHHRTEQHLRYLAHHDPLTDLLNRRGFDEALTSQLGHAPRGELDSCLMLLDLNHFKDVNDRCGHTVGDQVLVGLAEILRSRLRLADSIGRLGGDEFAVLLPETDADGAARIAREIGDEVTRGLAPTGGRGTETMTVSIGIASVSAALRNEIDLFDAADQAMYRAKAAGMGWTAVYGSNSVEPTASH